MSVELILGPMFSGKTSLLMQKIHRAEYGDQKSLVIKHTGDSRFGPEDTLANRNGLGLASSRNVRVVVADALLSDIEVTEPNIFIDEGQFFADLAEFCRHYARQGARVIVASLDADSDQRLFSNVAALMPFATYSKLTAVCHTCRVGDATITRRTDGLPCVLSVSNKGYIAQCVKCSI